MKTPLFVAGPSITIRLLILGILSLVLMAVDDRCDCLDPARSFIDTTLYPLYILTDLPFWATDQIMTQAVTRQQLLQDNAELRKQQRLLRAQVQKLAALRAENARLRELLHASARLEDRVLIAELLAVDLDPYKQQVLLNKGANHGVYQGQPIVDAHGVMGQVIQVNPLHAKVMLISDPNHALPVQVNRNGLRALALGTGSSHKLLLRHIPATADIQRGDVVSTSGLGGRFPSGYPVAEVIRIKHRPGEPFAEVILEPHAHLDYGREVLLVWPPGYGSEPTDPAGPTGPSPSSAP